MIARLVFATATFLAVVPASAMDLKSADVAEGSLFPTAEICASYGGNDVSPALSWSGVPANAKGLAITIFDPDAHGGWWHWAVIGIPASATALAQGAGSSKAALPDGAKQLENSNGDAAYGGPCPPGGSGIHHYQITLWALGDVPVASSAADLSSYLDKHALAKARITPVYQK